MKEHWLGGIAGILVVWAGAVAQPMSDADRGGPAKGADDWPGTLLLPHAAASGAFSPDGKLFASGDIEDGSINLWGADTGRRLRVLHGPRGSVQQLNFSADGKRLDSRTSRHKGRRSVLVCLWDVTTGKEIFRLDTDEVAATPFPDRPDRPVVFTADQRLAAIPRDGNTIQLVDVNTGKELQRIHGHAYWVRTLAFAVDGRNLVSGSADYTVRIWDTATGDELERREWEGERVHSVEFGGDGRLFVGTSHLDEKRSVFVRLWEFHERQSLGEALEGSVLSPDRKHLTISVGLGPCIGGAFGVVPVPRSLRLEDPDAPGLDPMLAGQIGGVVSPVFAPNGKSLAAVWSAPTVAGAKADLRAQLWSVPANKALVQVTQPSPGPTAIAFSPDGKTLAILGPHGSQLLPLTKLREFGGSLSSLAVAPDGKRLAVGTSNGSVQVWNIEAREMLGKLQGHDEPVHS